MNKQVVIDTSPIVAILSPTDNYHKICIETDASLCYLAESQGGASHICKKTLLRKEA